MSWFISRRIRFAFARPSSHLEEAHSYKSNVSSRGFIVCGLRHEREGEEVGTIKQG